MKNTHLLRLLATSVFMFALTSCEIETVEPNDSGCNEDGWGELRLENKSVNTVQQIKIGGTNYGTLDPGESKTYDLPVGSYTLTMDGISGGGGCGNPSEINIPDCGSVGRSCSN